MMILKTALRIHLFLFIAIICAVAHADEFHVTAVVSSSIRPFMLALDGFRSSMHGSISTNYIDANPALVRHRISGGGFDLVVAIGPAAAKMLWNQVNVRSSKLCLMVLDPEELLGRYDLCGVRLRIPLDIQFSMIAQRLGAGTRIGVLYNPAENGRLMGDAASLAQKHNIRFIPLKVEKREDVAGIFKSSTQFIDALFFIPDSVVISEAMVAYLIKNSLLNGIVPIGYNKFFLETGAVMAFIIDYRKCGELAADVAGRILKGSSCTMRLPPFEVEWNKNAWEVVQRVRKNQIKKISLGGDGS